MVNGGELPGPRDEEEGPDTIREDEEETVERYLDEEIDYGELVAELGEREAAAVETARRVLERDDVEVGDEGDE